jgi:hypothetical protein
LPLIFAEGAAGANSRPVSELQEWARKIKPQYAAGELVHVVGAHNQTEAQFIQGLLLEEGVPSMLRRSRGFDVPDFLAAGPRDVMVPESGVSAAREVLLESELLPVQSRRALGMDAPWRVMACLLAALALGAIIVWLCL